MLEVLTEKSDISLFIDLTLALISSKFRYFYLFFSIRFFSDVRLIMPRISHLCLHCITKMETRKVFTYLWTTLTVASISLHRYNQKPLINYK